MLGSHARNDLTLSPYDKDLFLYLYLSGRVLRGTAVFPNLSGI